MGAPKKRVRDSKRYTRKEFVPVAAAIGQLALAWNDLQEMLAVLFWQVMTKGKGQEALAAWYSLKSDRAQREMLKSAIIVMPASSMPSGFVTDAVWLINEANSLEDARNNAVHSPLFFYNSEIAAAIGLIGIRPAYNLGNPRAKNLSERLDLLAEFRWCRNWAMALGDYAQGLGQALYDKSRPWPKRPSRLIRAGKKSLRDHIHQVRKK